MSNVDYVYSIENDFPNHKVAPDRLEQQIESSSITTALAYISTSGDDCNIWFKASLSAEDEVTLDGIVATHSGEPLPSGAIPVELAGVPTTSDNKPIFLPNLFPGPDTLYLTGAADGDSTRGDGVPFIVTSSAAEDKSLDFGFVDAVYIAGGSVNATGGAPGDWINLELFAPASTVTPNGSGTGNCNLVEVVPGSGAHIIVPAAGNGAYDVDLSMAVPVPSGFDESAPAGYWEWSNPPVGKGTISVVTPGTGNYNLFDFPIFLARFCNRLPLVIPLDLTVPAIKPKKILPQWRMRATLHHSDTSPITVVWYLLTSRVKTVD